MWLGKEMLEIRSKEFEAVLQALHNTKKGSPMLQAACDGRARKFIDELAKQGFEVTPMINVKC